MGDLWHPDEIPVHAPTNMWGSYAAAAPARGVLHTTESDYYPPSTSNYFGGTSWPHSTIGEAKDGRRGIFGHIPLNRAARALKNLSGGVETNRAGAVQCEIVWRAQNAPAMPEWLLDLVASWMRFVEAELGVQRTAVTFHGPGEGFTVASASAPQRMKPAEWNAFDGWCGHQHVPENDHWDPGKIDIARLLALPPPPEPTPIPEPAEDDYVMDFFIIKENGGSGQWLWFPELGADKGRRVIIADGADVAQARKSRFFGGDLEWPRDQINGIPEMSAD